MGKKIITIKDIRKGTLFCEPECAYPRNEIMRVVDIEYSKNAGKVIKDMWGGVVWSEPFGTIVAVGEITGEKRKYVVQSEDSELSDWLSFINKKSDREKLIYESRREDVVRIAKEHISKILKALDELPKDGKEFEKDQKMKNLFEAMGNAVLAVY